MSLARITLQLAELSRKSVEAPGGRRDVVHLRPYVRVWLGAALGIKSAILDTGAPVSVFPIGIWDQIPGVVVIPEHRDAPFEKLPLLTVTQFTYRVRNAWVEVVPVDAADDRVRLGPTLVYSALCVQRVVSKADTRPCDDANGLKHVLMGVGAGVLDNRTLVLSPHAILHLRAAWLQDERPTPPPWSVVSSRVPSIP